MDKKFYFVAGVTAVLLIVLFWHKDAPKKTLPLDGTPVLVLLSGTYVCLSFTDTKAPTTGFRTI